MCGQCGVYSTTWLDTEYKLFKNLLYINETRGTDSTGVIRVSKKTDGDGFTTRSKKTLLPAGEFLMHKNASDIIRSGYQGLGAPICILGHTRAATVGKVEINNAHPFRFDGVIGTHNGTIKKHFTGKDKFGTDSEAFYNLINQNGLKEAIEEVNDHDSAYAIQFIDFKKNTLNFVKNSQRPLWFTYLFSRSALIWSSEKEHLEFILKLAKLSHNTGWKGQESKFFTLHPNHLLSIPLGESPENATITDLGIPEVEKKAFPSTIYTTSYGGSSGQAHTTSSTQTKSPSVSKMGANGKVREGQWLKTESGYRFVPYKKQTTMSMETSSHPKLLPDLSTGGSGQPSTTGGKSSKSTQGKSSTSSPSTGDGFGGYKDRFSPSDLKSLSWLKPADDQGKLSFDQSVHDKIGTLDDGIEWVENPEPTGPYDNVMDDLPWKDNVVRIKGYKGQMISEGEFRYRMKSGCSLCGVSYNLDDPHDIAGINSIHWYHREVWTCHQCYEDNDWVQFACDGWPDYPKKAS